VNAPLPALPPPPVTWQDELQGDEETLSAARLAIERLAARKKEKATELADALRKRSSVEVELQEAEASAKGQAAARVSIQAQLEEVSAQVEECEGELEEIEPQYEEGHAALESRRDELAQTQSRVEALYGKQGRGRQFTSKNERNAFLQTQIDSLSGQVTSKQELRDRMRREIEKDDKAQQKELDMLTKAEEENRARTARGEELTKAIQEATQRRNELQENRKKCWRDLEVLQEQVAEARDAFERGKQQLNSSLPRTISQGLATVDKIVEEKGLRGYYGPLIDNFELSSEGYRTAVEVAAGNALFHVVVDTDATAAQLMKELERRKAGRLTFLPLNRLRNPDVRYPDSTDVRPLMSVALTYAPAMAEAVKQVFSKKLIARDLDTAAHFSKEYQLDAITKDGDQVNRKGGFEGGYHDERVSRFGAVMKIREAVKRRGELEVQEAALKKRSDDADVAVNDAIKELQKLEAEREHTRANLGRLTKELAARSKQLAAAGTAIQARKEEVRVTSRPQNTFPRDAHFLTRTFPR